MAQERKLQIYGYTKLAIMRVFVKNPNSSVKSNHRQVSFFLGGGREDGQT